MKKTKSEGKTIDSGEKKIKTLETSIARFCAYQERTIEQVRSKLKDLEAENNIADKIIEKMIDEGFLNEERFAFSYVLGKFRQNKWGKMKIRYTLRGKGIKNDDINKALGQLDEEEYREQAVKLFHTKIARIKGNNPVNKKLKVIAFMVSKGFENDLIWDIIRKEGIK